MQLEISVFGDVQFSRQLLRFAERANNMVPVFEVLSRDFYEMERQQFASEGASASGGWAPLAPSTVAHKAAVGAPQEILQYSGDLLRSLTRSNAKGSRKRIRPDEMEIGTAIRYAAFHQKGTRRMPQRRPVELRASDRVRWVKAMQRWIVSESVGSESSALSGALAGF